MPLASSSAVAWTSRQTWRSCPSFSSPIAAATGWVTGSASAASRMPASSRARISAAACPASAALAGGAAAAAKSRMTICAVQARSQARSAGRLRTWRASIRDSSSAVAAAGLGPVGEGGQRVADRAGRPAEVPGDLADRVRARARGQPLGNLGAKLAVAETALRGRGRN